MPITIPNIVKPFEEFKWRWMEFTPVESFNRPDILLGITRAINECEGEAASSDAFIGKLSVIQRDLLHGSGITLVPADRTRNVLRRQGRYWRGFGLLSNDSTRALRLTDFGQKYADGTYSNDDFVSSIIKNHTLPNIRIEKPEIVGLWQDANITIRPLELILQILSVLDDTAPAGQNYITPHELAKVVVPLSIAWRQPSDFAEAVMLYRSNPNAFSLLPDCTPEANDRRMVREHLLFLYEYEVLERTQGDRHGNDYERYWLNKADVESVQELIDLPEPPPPVSPANDEISPIIFSPTASRTRRLVEVTSRPNQSGFRRAVLNNCGKRCLLTGESTSDVLIACHIHEVKDGGSDNSDNGLVLRADLHILFDKNKLRISDEGVISLSPDVKQSSDYSRLPEQVDIPSTINRELLRRRFKYGRILNE